MKSFNERRDAIRDSVKYDYELDYGVRELVNNLIGTLYCIDETIYEFDRKYCEDSIERTEDSIKRLVSKSDDIKTLRHENEIVILFDKINTVLSERRHDDVEIPIRCKHLGLYCSILKELYEDITTKSSEGKLSSDIEVEMSIFENNVTHCHNRVFEEGIGYTYGLMANYLQHDSYNNRVKLLKQLKKINERL